MALTKQKLLHKRSSVVGRILAPSALTYGEIAVNFSSGANNSFLEIKKYDDKPALYFEHPYGTYSTTISGSTNGYWSANISGVTEYYDGLSIYVRLGTSYDGSWNTLNVNGLGSKIVWFRYNGRLTSHYGQWSELRLTYRTAAGSFQATATARGLISGTTYKDGWVCENVYDTTDIYSIYDYYSPRTVGANKLWGYKFCAIDVNGNVQPLVLDSGNGTNKTVNTTPFRPDKIYQKDSADVAANARTSHNSLMHCGYLSTPHYTFNETLTTYKTVYLKGTLDITTGLFTLSSGKTDFYRFVPNTTNNLVLSDYFEDGFYYIRLGNSYSSNNYMYLEMVNPMYYFDGTNLIENTDTKVANAASNAKGFLLAHTAQTKTATSITNASVWMSGGTLYSNAKKVSNLIVCSLTQTQYDSLSSYDPDMLFAISGETPSNSDEKVKTATATTKAYLVGKAATTGTTTGITHGNVYMSGGVLYSNGSAVLTAQTSVSITNSGDGVVTGGTTGGTAGHSITLNKTTAVKVNSATTADAALNVMMTTGVAATSASITLDTTAARTYKIYSGTTASITLDATVQNPGYEHYALFKNTGSGNMVITPKTGWVTTDSTFTVASGKYMELSYICAGSQLIITGSKVMITK